MHEQINGAGAPCCNLFRIFVLLLAACVLCSGGISSAALAASMNMDVLQFGNMDQSGMAWMDSLGMTSKVYFWDHGSTRQIACQSGYMGYSSTAPAIDDGKAAWMAASGDGPSIFYWDGNTVTELAHVSNASGYSLTTPGLDGGKVSWIRTNGASLNVYYWDGATVNLVANQANPGNYSPSSPSLSNGQAAWIGENNRIYFWDGNTVAPITADSGSAPYSLTSPVLENGVVFWSQAGSGAYTVCSWDGASTTYIAAQGGSYAYSLTTPSVSNRQAAWLGPDGQIYFWDGATVAQITRYSNPDAYSPTSPVLDRGGIAWKEIRPWRKNYYFDWWTLRQVDQFFPGNEALYYWDGVTTTQISSQSTPEPYTPTLPMTNNGNVAWKGPEGNLYFWNGNYVQNISDNDLYVTQVTTADSSWADYSLNTNIRLSNGEIAWVGDGRIFKWDGQTISIPATISDPAAYTSVSLSLDNGGLAWKETALSGNEHIYFSDGATVTLVAQNSQPGQYSLTGLDLDNNTLAWGKFSGAGLSVYYWNGATTTLLSTSLGSDYSPSAPSVDDGKVAWLGADKEIYYWNGTGVIPITASGKGVSYTIATAPVLDNGTIAWSGTDNNILTIYYWNGATTIPIASVSNANAYSPATPALSNGRIAWRGDLGDIYFWDGGSVQNITSCGNPGGYSHTSWPALENYTVAWSESGGYSKTAIYYWDGAAITEVARYTEASAYTPTGPPALSNGALAWVAPDGSINYWDGNLAHDRDQDGIPDQFDRHPDTPPGTAVYSDGGRADDLYNQIERLGVGDMDLDNDVDADDLAAYAALYGTPALYTKAQLDALAANCDTDGDGKIGLVEAIRALQIIAGFD